ncbi:hypothetical protein BDP27DRAFT_1401827 [Rhodocollybia butyracea]|uniref:Uncharacterized protein n=1 Tax=Rhodocollybia butyracea TaxID=206335 RepID=A0A9P5U882_9AGAR|nr:hypothetical protein BDP27DRAFT_1401827 [Rhodocollybia butyracea]
MCAQRWYPEGYVLPTSSAHPPGPYHPAYTQNPTSHSSGPKPWYAPKLQTPPSDLRDHSGARRSSSSSQTRNSSSSSHAHSEEMARIAGVGDPGLITGVDYFKIGETVRIRRLNASNAYTDWAYGQVTRPHLRQYRPTEPERVYFVSYIDPRNGDRKENEFSCFRKEIAPLFDKKESPLMVFAQVPLHTSRGPIQTWIPACVTDNTDSGLVVQAISGHARYKGIRSIVPYRPTVAQSLKATGQPMIAGI